MRHPAATRQHGIARIGDHVLADAHDTAHRVQRLDFGRLDFRGINEPLSCWHRARVFVKRGNVRAHRVSEARYAAHRDWRGIIAVVDARRRVVVSVLVVLFLVGTANGVVVRVISQCILVPPGAGSQVVRIRHVRCFVGEVAHVVQHLRTPGVRAVVV